MRRLVFGSLFVLAVACGGSTPPPSEPAPPAASVSEPAPSASPAASASAAPAPAPAPKPAPTAAAPAIPHIDFPEHASVEAAIKAVPQGLPRLNMSQDALDAPLLDHARYEGCKVPPSVHFTVTAAVFDGAAVGVDVVTKPKNKALEACIDGVVRSMKWQKVPSVNTVTANF